jgi:hypothetical protein
MYVDKTLKKWPIQTFSAAALGLLTSIHTNSSAVWRCGITSNVSLLALVTYFSSSGRYRFWI